MNESRIVAISVSRTTLNVCYCGKRMAYMRNSPAGLEILLCAVRAQAPSLVAIEPCDGLEGPLAEAIANSGIAVAVLESDEVARFARVTGRGNGGRTDARTVYACAARHRAFVRYRMETRPHTGADFNASV